MSSSKKRLSLSELIDESPKTGSTPTSAFTFKTIRGSKRLGGEYWKKQFEEKEYNWKDINKSSLYEKITDNISNKYRNVYKNCFFKKPLKISIGIDYEYIIYWDTQEEINLSMSDLDFIGASFSEELALDEAVESCCTIQDVKLICIPLFILLKKELVVAGEKELIVIGHANIILINNETQEIELYDPNGYKYHVLAYENKIVELLKSKSVSWGIEYPVRLAKIKDIHLHSTETVLIEQDENEGICWLWSLYLAELRAKYIDSLPQMESFVKAILKRLVVIQKHIIEIYGEDRYEDIIGLYFLNYILEFAGQPEIDELNPKSPVDIP